jgi:hypothetical protein
MEFAAYGQFCSEHIEKNLKKQPLPPWLLFKFKPFRS